MSRKRHTISPAKRLRYRLELAVFATAAWLGPRLPRRALRRFGRAAGWLAFQLAADARRTALANLDTAFGATKTAPEKRRLARESFQTFAATMATMFWAPRLTAANLPAHAEVDEPSFQRLLELKRAGRPVVFLVMHYGDFELLSVATALRGQRTTIIQEALRNEALTAFLARLRGASGHEILPNRRSARTLLARLRAGGNIALLIDLNANRASGGVWLKFFGLPVFSSAAAAALACHTQAVLVGSVAWPLPDGRSRLVYGPFLEARPATDKDAEIQRLSQECLDWVETTIRAAPAPWLWLYKRWKYQPPAHPGPFPWYARVRRD